MYPTTTDYVNPTLLDFSPEVVKMIGHFPDIGGLQQKIYLVNYFLLIFTDFWM